MLECMENIQRLYAYYTQYVGTYSPKCMSFNRVTEELRK